MNHTDLGFTATHATPPVVSIAPDENLTDPVWRNAEQHPETSVISRDPLDASTVLDAVQFRDTVLRVSKGLVAAGVQPGDRVAIMSHSRFEWVACDYAIWAAGGVTVPVYETSSPEQTHWILSDSGAVAAIVETPAHAVTIAEVRKRLPKLKRVWQIEADPGAEAVLTQMGSAVSDDEITTRRRGLRADDVASIIYTSGTEGRPKGCMITHRNLLAVSRNAITLFREEFSPGGRTVLFLPLAHVLPREIQVCCIAARVTLHLCSDPTQLLEVVGYVKPNIMLAIPRLLQKVHAGSAQKAHEKGKDSIFAAAESTAVQYSEALETGRVGVLLRMKRAFFDFLLYRKLRDALGGECRTLISGGAPLGTFLAHFFRGAGIHVKEGWGLTETTASATVNTPERTRIGTVGPPLPGVELAAADDAEIFVRGDTVFTGYWNNEKATREVYTKDRWFATGDLGVLDDEGYLSITGRKKELLVTAGGKNVAPSPLEERVIVHPLVNNCVVIGDGERFISCLVTLDPEVLETWKREHHKESELSLEELKDDPDLRATVQRAIDSTNATVSRAEQIKVFRILDAEFSVENGVLTPSMKVKRDVVSERFASDIREIYG